MIADRPLPRWQRRNPRELRMMRLRDDVVHELLAWAPNGDVARALGRAERALHTAADLARESVAA